MYANELDNFRPDIPELGQIPQFRFDADAPVPDASPTLAQPAPEADFSAFAMPQVPLTGELSDADAALFKSVVEKYFSEDAPKAEPNLQPSDKQDDVQPDRRKCMLKDNGFGIGIPETELVRNLHYEEVDTIDQTEIRKQFPILDQKVNGKDLVWFDNGASTQKPLRVIDGLSHFYKTDYSNIHRGAHTLAARSTDQYEGAREKVARFINAPSVDNIVFVRGTTEGINLVAQTFGRKYLLEGDNVIVSTLDHHANIVPWQQVCKERKAELRAIPTDRNGDLILTEFERLITPRTKFVSVGHVNNTYGTINNVAAIIKIAHSHNIPVLIDGAQSVAHTKIDVQDMDCDFFVFSGHKIYGPSGIGVVYGKKEALAMLPPWQGGGNMIKDVTIERTEFNEPPARFEAGTPTLPTPLGWAMRSILSTAWAFTTLSATSTT